ncbi:hypothetical protein [Arsenophonus sp. PmNCSU2021_1]|uniref:hypothetical protein n=1 Tax=Arsenophonus sp. PmNCSU2021_1 TaxID=3118989 RepID=UPI003FA58A1F
MFYCYWSFCCSTHWRQLHDRGKSGGWLLLLLLAFVLFSIDVSLFTPFWQWGIGRFLPFTSFAPIKKRAIFKFNSA